MLFFCAVFCFSSVSFCQENTTSSQKIENVSVQDIDEEIAKLQADINRYKGLASMYQEQAQLVEFRDYNGYRDAASLQQKCQDIVNSMTEHLNLLEQEKAAMAVPKDSAK